MPPVAPSSTDLTVTARLTNPPPLILFHVPYLRVKLLLALAFRPLEPVFLNPNVLKVCIARRARPDHTPKRLTIHILRIRLQAYLSSDCFRAA